MRAFNEVNRPPKTFFTQLLPYFSPL